jgi:hypothetical protein
MHGLDVGGAVAASSFVCGAAEAMECYAPEAVVEGLAVCCESESEGEGCRSSEEGAGMHVTYFCQRLESRSRSGDVEGWKGGRDSVM